MTTKKKIILVGKAASGKDYFRSYLISKGYKTSISHTTRPMRKGEVNGLDYHYISKYNFIFKKLTFFFFENKKFNGWYYGTSKAEVKRSEVFILTPSGINSLSDKFLKDCFIIYFDIPKDLRVKRLNKRSDSDTIDRRIKADEIDFKHFVKYNVKVTNPNFNCEKLMLSDS